MEHQHNEGTLKTTIRNSFLILLFELIGTMFLTLLYLCHAKVIYTFHLTNLNIGLRRFLVRLLRIVNFRSKGIRIAL